MSKAGKIVADPSFEGKPVIRMGEAGGASLSGRWDWGARSVFVVEDRSGQL